MVLWFDYLVGCGILLWYYGLIIWLVYSQWSEKGQPNFRKCPFNQHCPISPPLTVFSLISSQHYQQKQVIFDDIIETRSDIKSKEI